jgi:predicted nucleic acid-binding protein
VKEIFVDTSAWSAIADGNDPNHEIALSYRDEIAGHCRLVATSYILDELYTLMLMNQGYRYTVDFKGNLDIMIQDSVLEIVWVTEDLTREAWSVFEQFNVDKQWSFTDCVAYVVMRHRGITEAFAFDHHFDQMGFARKPQV